MRYAYADPPYIDQAKRHYKNETICMEVNHRVLLGYLCQNFDGWAMSCSSTSLQRILKMDTCPSDIRIGSWVKPFASFKPNVNPAYTWEPVVYWRPKKRSREESTIKDHLIENITLKKGLAGAKPIRFCFWVFQLLGIDENDELIDVFPGTGIVTSAWNSYKTKNQSTQLKILC